MLVLRSTMDAALEAERAKVIELARTYGEAVRKTTALQSQLADWITDKGEKLTPEQFASLFWPRDDRWQAAFFNALEGTAQASWDAYTPRHANEYRGILGYPAGEGSTLR